MDTKSKKISRHIGIKAIAFVFVCILIGIIVSQVFYIDAIGLDIESLVVEQYKDSRAFRIEVLEAFNRTSLLLTDQDESIMDNINFIFAAGLEDEIIATNRFDFDREDFAQYDETFFAYEYGKFAYGTNTNPDTNLWLDVPASSKIYIAFTDEYMKVQEDNWYFQREKLIETGIILAISILVSLALIIYLMVVTGKKTLDEKLHSNWMDRLYTEVLIFLFIPLGIPWFIGVGNSIHWQANGTYNLSTNQVFDLVFIGAVSFITAALYGYLLLALTRKIKDGRFIKDLLMYRVIDFFRSFFDGRRFAKFPLTKSLHQRQIIFIVASFFLVLFTWMFIWSPFVLLFPLLELVLIYWYVKYNNETYKEINKGFDDSIQEQMKAERMKLELITNVSHDLKTPLTSIISYVDLLSKEEELSDSAKDYVSILADKSDRLKNIVSDLFDLAKSSSGDINLELETLDLKKLIEQTIGDMADNIEESGQQVKINITEKSINIYTDGKKMYRVFQNVIDNALKYSLPGTRIFIELEEKNGKGIATIRNTSNYEMDFTSEEILGRFSRGDKSRTTEGSGLGLSIAESFTRVCGGDFRINIDGDVFKVIISFDIIGE